MSLKYEPASEPLHISVSGLPSPSTFRRPPGGQHRRPLPWLPAACLPVPASVSNQGSKPKPYIRRTNPKPRVLATRHLPFAPSTCQGQREKDLFIHSQTHDHFTPTREIKQHARALAHNHPEGWKGPCRQKPGVEREYRTAFLAVQEIKQGFLVVRHGCAG